MLGDQSERLWEEWGSGVVGTWDLAKVREYGPGEGDDLVPASLACRELERPPSHVYVSPS